MRNLFKLEKENIAIKDRIIRDTKTLFEQEEEDYYKPVRFGNFYNNNYMKYESNCNSTYQSKNTLIKLISTWEL